MEPTPKTTGDDRNLGHATAAGVQVDPVPNLTTPQESKAERYRRRTADVLHSTASKVRNLGTKAPGGERSTRWGLQAGGGIEQAADYLRGRSTDQISRDMRDWLQKNPGPALACAATVGFLAGIALRRR